MSQTKAATPSSKNKQAVTPELVRQVADKVYELWLWEMQIEKERRRWSDQRWQRR
jgi:hypothetical protein